MTPGQRHAYHLAELTMPDDTPTSELLPLTPSDLDLRVESIREGGLGDQSTVRLPVTPAQQEFQRWISEPDERDDSEPPLWPLLLTLTLIGMAIGAGIVQAAHLVFR